jgi:hypothetical protein
MAFSTVFHAFLKTFIYKTPIQNIDVLYESGTKLYYPPNFKFIFENGEGTEVSKVQKNLANCSSLWVCVDWAKNHKNVSILFSDLNMALYYAIGITLDENFEPYLCRLEDGLVYNDDLRMIMLQGDPLMKRVTEIIDCVVEAGIYNFWISKNISEFYGTFRKISHIHLIDGYYSYNLYHMQPAFYLLLMGWCLSVLCFMGELMYRRVSSKRKCF